MPRLRLPRPLWIALAFGIVTAAICVGATMAYLGAVESLEAEKTLHSTIFVIRLVEQFVNDQKRWPRSWEELESLDPHPENDRYEWPAASKELQKRVSIDFDADPSRIAEQPSMSFTAIKPIGPYYEYRDYAWVPSLQRTIRNTTATLR